MTSERVWREIRTAEDAEAVRDIIESMADDGWGRDPETGRFDWEAFFERLESYHGLDFGGDWSSPAIKQAKAIARTAAEAGMD